jgi:hypothetical protein
MNASKGRKVSKGHTRKGESVVSKLIFNTAGGSAFFIRS